MMRSFAIAAGLSLILLGGEFMVVDRLVMADLTTPATNDFASFTGLGTTARRVFVPPEWAPWGLLSGGVVTVLYAATMGERGSGD